MNILVKQIKFPKKQQRHSHSMSERNEFMCMQSLMIKKIPKLYGQTESPNNIWDTQKPKSQENVEKTKKLDQNKNIKNKCIKFVKARREMHLQKNIYKHLTKNNYLKLLKAPISNFRTVHKKCAVPKMKQILNKFWNKNSRTNDVSLL